MLKELEREIVGLAKVQPDGWVDLDDLTCHIPVGLVTRCAVETKNWYYSVSSELVRSIVTPPRSGPVLAMAMAGQFTALETLVYPRRVRPDEDCGEGYVPVTVESHFHQRPMDFLLARECPAGFGPFLVVDDVVRTGGTLDLLIHNVQRLWGVRCLGAVALVEIAGAGGRERLAGSFPGLPVLALARV